MKAVIMAGGEGKRLRPLTCTVPKPMAKILAKPVIEYIFELLSAHGVTQAAVTLGYLPHVIERNYENGYKKLKLEFLKEDEPLGTAGSVKNAASGFDEPFFVISGDAFCDFDLKKIMRFHLDSKAKITIIATEKPDPREYGLIKTGEDNRVTGFIEKPSWNQAVSNLINTGVYVINPECLELIPSGKSFDFASDLFPLMLERGMQISCCRTDGYWCDIGNTEAFLDCQRDIFDGKINFPISSVSGVISDDNGLSDRKFRIVPPVFIGENVEIEDGAVIGPYTVIENNCYIGKNAKIRRSVISENCCLASGATVTGALVCSGAALKNRAEMYENSVAGSGCVIGENARLNSGVLVWPGKIVGSGVTVNSDVKYGNITSDLLGDNGIDEKHGVRLNPEFCVKLGMAVGSTVYGKKTAVSTDGTRTAEMMKMAVVSGLSAVGSAVWDFGECFETEHNFLVNYCGLDSGLFIGADDERFIRICGESGLPITRRFERELENGVSKCEFRNISEGEIIQVSDMSNVKFLYEQELLKSASHGLDGVGVTFRSKNESIRILLEKCVFRLGAHESDSLIIELDKSGRLIGAQTDNADYDFENLFAVCCFDEMKNGKDIAVPYDSPAFFDSVAERYGRKVYRYLNTPADDSDSSARRLAADQIFVRDGLFLAIKILSLIKKRACSLDDIVAEIPDFCVIKKTVEIDFSPAKLSDYFCDKAVSSKNDFEGIRVANDSGRLLIIPERGGGKVKILAEANSMEIAEELCSSVEDIIENVSEFRR